MYNLKFTAAVNNLPEYYQPIYGHEDLPAKAGASPLRNCRDRLADIKKIYDALSRKLQRHLRVLDLGCAQGFFSLNVAAWGGVVTGVDFGKENIELCQILTEEHPDYHASFINMGIEDFIPSINVGEYDLVICQSVLHLMSKHFGWRNVQAMTMDLAKKINTGIFEFAVEKVHKSYIPANYREFLKGYSFVRVLSYNEHRNGSDIKRPHCFASNEYAYFEKLGILKIDNFTYHVHPYMPKEDLVHFNCGGMFVKYFYINNQSQLDRAKQEIKFLKDLGGQNGLPKLYEVFTEQDETGIRIFIVRDRIPGITLSEKIERGEEFDRWNVIRQALKWMIFLEQHGYYHGDIGAQNFVYNDNGELYPIDYEEMWREPIVVIWPYKVNLQFLIFMNSVLAPRQRKFAFHRDVRLLTELRKHIPQRQYEQILEIKESEKFFVRLYEILFQSQDKPITYNLAELELLAIERYMDDIGQRLSEYQGRFEQLNALVPQLIDTVKSQQRRIEQLEQIVKERFK